MCLWDIGRNGQGHLDLEVQRELPCERQMDLGVRVREMVTEYMSLFVIIQGKQAE